jgi:hypothetical protein
MDLEQYASNLRESAAFSFSENYDENLDDFISIGQVKNLVDHYSSGKDEEDRYLVDENSHNMIFDDIRTWLHNVGLARLAGKDLVECAWDNDTNQMIFWLKDNNISQHPNEPMKNAQKQKARKSKRKNS